MAHIMGAQLRNPGQPPLIRDYLRFVNSATMKFQTIGSGAVIATINTGECYVKALDFSVYNTPAFILRDGAGTLVSFASGAVGGQRFQPCWYHCKAALTLSKASGTAETGNWGVLVATSAWDDPNAALA